MRAPIASKARICWQNLTHALSARNTRIDYMCNFVIGESGPELTNYRIAGRYYVVDRLFNQAELRLGTGWGAKKVQIHRQTPIAGGPRG